MLAYAEIEDTKEIRRLNNSLSAKLRNALLHAEARTIGFPQGSFRAKVRFRSSCQGDVLYWSGGYDKTTAVNFFGHGAPRTKAQLNIDVQFNLPVVNFSRQSGGAFLRHLPSNSVILAHRGIVTLGHGRVAKSDLFGAMADPPREAATTAGTADFLLVGELESPTLIDDIDAFSSELRRALKMLKSNRKGPQKIADDRHLNRPAKIAAKLRSYFDEFSGQRLAGSGKKSIADCYHGTVVRAIRDGFDGSAQLLKSKAIDLTVLTSRRAFLFEAKTSADIQSVYTAIGQLAVHAPSVAEIAMDTPVVKVIVLPELPRDWLRNLIENKLDIRLLTFTRSAQGAIDIDGLNKLQTV